MQKIKVTIWNEFRHEKTKENVKALYPNGLHAVIGEFLARTGEMEVTLAALDDPAQGLPEDVLENTEVMLWWGHMALTKLTMRWSVGFKPVFTRGKWVSSPSIPATIPSPSVPSWVPMAICPGGAIRRRSSGI